MLVVEEDLNLTAIAHLIRLSLAPAFMISGIGSILAIMMTRLGRIVDRQRLLQERNGEIPDNVTELLLLSRRAKAIAFAIGLCTVTVLLIATVVGLIFLGAFLEFKTAKVIAAMFITAMVAFFFSLLSLLREMFLGTIGLRARLARSRRQPPPSE